ncbi:OLC1v1021853C1 [Oldenlandia corymbosa var. corymbosa]|uniref:OLC1v1021853C1 n=1 Tax=Oldenlandia corymbosa var. corymbosa TaxID=529605 RepID=A0AAV1BWT1_OLDCO|nr:OLC1v1021853C1 [Oldenlandia corymbosa var. corymbosa]
MCCDLEVDVNGQGIFYVNKKILSCYSGRIRKLFMKSNDKSSRLKLIFHDFPGGAEGFQLITQFCYNGGSLSISPSNVILLHSAGIFLEMNETNSGPSSLVSQTEEYFRGSVHQWVWADLLECLKQCQYLLHFISSSDMFRKLLDCVVGRLLPCSFPSPYASSTDSSCINFSGDMSRESISNYSSETTTNSWFEDLVFLRIDIIEKLVETMISKKWDTNTISSFLFHYQRMKFNSTLVVKRAEKRRIIETVIDLLSLLDRSLISIRHLFYNLRLSVPLKLSKCSKKQLENLIGSVLDKANLDDLIFPSPPEKNHAYDVDLILRLQKQFLLESTETFPMHRSKKVALLLDSYIAEVAPDPNLQSSKFVALTTALPAIARDSHDRIYQALDMYLKVHDKLSIEERIKICEVLDYQKLSAEFLIELAQNMSFPGSARLAASFSHHSKLRSISNNEGYVTKRFRTNIVDDRFDLSRGKQTEVEKFTEFGLTCPDNINPIPAL